jgi:predicted Zn-dependent protease
VARQPNPLPPVVRTTEAPEVAPLQQLPQPTEQQPNDEERAVLLGAARTAAARQQWDVAVTRYEEYFRRFGNKDLAIRKEYAGILVRAGKARQAFQEYQQLLAQTPNDQALRLLAADVAVISKEYKAAINLLLPLVQQDPKNAEAAVRLAQAYLFDDDVNLALETFDRYLTPLRPDDERTPRLLPALLVDLERSADALTLLKPMLERRPKDAELLATLVRAYSRLGDGQRAAEALQTLAALGTEAQGPLAGLADTLLASGDFELAGLAYQQVLKLAPGNVDASVGLARVAMQQFQPAQAWHILEGLKPSPAERRNFMLALAEYHQLVGELIEARTIYLDLLCRDPADHEVRLSLAALYELPAAEREKARAEYGKIPPGTPQYRRARVGIGSTLTAQRHFPEAVAVLKMLLEEFPADGNAAGQLVRTLGKSNCCAEAAAAGRAFLDANARNLRAVLSVRLGLGRAFLDCGKPGEAAREYEMALTLPGGRTLEAYYGLSRVAALTGNPARARQLLEESLTLPGGPIRNLLLLADLFDGDADTASSLEMVQAAVKDCPDNLAGLIRLATALGREARQSGQIDQAVASAKDVLARSPTNYRAYLVLARALASGQKYADSATAYGELIRLEPALREPRRERARVLQSGHQFDAAQAAYRELLEPPAEAVLQGELAELARKYPQLAARSCLFRPPLVAGPLRTDRVVKPAVADPEAEQAVLRVQLDYEARSAEQSVDRLEAEVKDRDWQNFAMQPVARNLLTQDPIDTSVWFDLGQAHSALKQTQKAIEVYGQDLAVDPREREAAIAIERASLEMSPQARFLFDFSSESGRDGLANIRRLRYITQVRYPYGDEDEYVSLGFTRADYLPPHDPSLQGNILSAGFQSKFCGDRLFLGGVLNIEQYPDRLSDRPTFDTSLRYVFCDYVTGRAGLFLENVVENGASLRQDIYRYGTHLGADLTFSRFWTLNGTYTYGHYSDRNDYNELYLRTDYKLSLSPCELKAVFDFDFLGYRASTVFGPGPDPFVGIIHPYFAPKSYFFYEGRIEWKQWLSRDYFAHSNQCWYSLQYGLGWDNQFVNYNSFRFLFNWDAKPWLSVGVDAYLTFSPVYDAGGVMAYLILRCPGWCR